VTDWVKNSAQELSESTETSKYLGMLCMSGG